MPPKNIDTERRERAQVCRKLASESLAVTRMEERVEVIIIGDRAMARAPLNPARPSPRPCTSPNLLRVRSDPPDVDVTRAPLDDGLLPAFPRHHADAYTMGRTGRGHRLRYTLWTAPFSHGHSDVT